MKVRRFVPYVVTAVLYASLFLAYRTLMPVIERGYYGPSPEARRFATLRHELRINAEALRDVMIRDSILPLIPKQPGLAIMLPDSGSHPTEYLRRVAGREVVGVSEVAVPIMSVSVNYGNVAEIPDAFHSTRYYAGDRENGAPYCAVVVPYFNADPMFNARRGSLVGQCKVWMRYGSAGSHVAAWMRNTGGHFALTDAFWWFDVEYAPPSSRQQFRSQFMEPFESRRCRAGDLTACTRTVVGVDPGTASTPTLSIGHRVPWRNSADAGLVVDMEREFGPERFQRFWKSPRPVDQAFEAAFGVGLGEWVQEWSETRYGPITIGSRMKVETILLSLLFIGLFIGLAVATAHGRRI